VSGAAVLPSQGDVLWVRQTELSGDGIDPLPKEIDVLVVGAGYTGVSAARELARRGRSVLVLEQGPIGFGASSRNAGFVHAGVRRSLPELRRRFGPQLGAELYGETVAALGYVGELVDALGIDCDYKRSGYLYLAQTRAQAKRLQASRTALSEAGQNCTLLDSAAVSDQAGTDGYKAGLLLDGAASIHPARFLGGLVRDAASVGARFSAGTRVLEIEQDGKMVAVSTPKGTVRAGHVLVATDGYTADLLPSLRRRIIPIDSFIAATEPLPAELQALVSPRGHMCLETKNFLCYWRIAGDGRLIFGGRASFSPTTVGRAEAWLRRRIDEIYPFLAEVPIASTWGGKTGFSFDQLPHQGREGNVTYAVTYCGGGVALATWLGARSARWIDGEDPPPFARIPFPKVPLFNGRPWFLPLVGPAFALQDRI
jgi:glycine/D-amino acid oxidase-like deaminating enzyme